MIKGIKEKRARGLDFTLLSVTLLAVPFQFAMKSVAYRMHPVGIIRSGDPAWKVFIAAHTEVYKISILAALVVLAFSILLFKASALPAWIKAANFVVAIIMVGYALNPPV